MPYRDPSQSPSATAAYFGEGYYRLYRDRLMPRAQTEAEASFLLSALAPDRGQRWLDCPCGYGRHLLALARLRPDLRLAGCDLNGGWLRERGLSRRAALACCDMRALPFATGRFHVVLNMLNSFGYFGGAAGGDRAVLAQWRRVLRPGGRLVMDLPNRRALLAEVRRHPRIRYCAGDAEAEEQFEWDPATQCLHNRTVWRWPGGGETAGYRLRLYTPAQVTALLTRAGFAIERTWGDFGGEPFDPYQSDRQLVLARRQD